MKNISLVATLGLVVLVGAGVSLYGNKPTHASAQPTPKVITPAPQPSKSKAIPVPKPVGADPARLAAIQRAFNNPNDPNHYHMRHITKVMAMDPNDPNYPRGPQWEPLP